MQQGAELDLEDGTAQDEMGGGMNLSFQPMLLTFTDICYFVDRPVVCSPLACAMWDDLWT